MAERSLNTILTEINTFIKTVDFGSKITTWTKAYLQEQDGKTFPLLNEGSGQGRKIQWNDTYPLQTYHRILSNTTDVLPSFLSGKEYLETGEHEVIKQNVYDEEFANTVELKKLSLEGIAFWIDYTIKIKTC